MVLFVRKNLQQDTGLLRERWDQEGSTVISATGFDGSTLLTVLPSWFQRSRNKPVSCCNPERSNNAIRTTVPNETSSIKKRA